MTRLNPLKILLGWTVLMLVLTPILSYISDIGSAGGEQKLLTTFAIMLILYILVSALICVVTPFFFKGLFKANKWFVVLAVFLLLPSSVFLWKYYFETRYSSVEQNREVDGNKIEIETEYYDNKKVRSKSFWKNGKKDSTWTVYAKDGKLLSEKIYHKDSLLGEK